MESKKLVVNTDVRQHFTERAAAAFNPVNCLPPESIIPYNNAYVEITIELLEDRSQTTSYLTTCKTAKGAIFFVFITLCEEVNGSPQIRKQFINTPEYVDYCIRELKDKSMSHPRAIL